MSNRYEIMPFGSAEEEARLAPRPLALTVTCSPRHGLDDSVDLALRVAALGHDVTVHLAARMLRDAEHLDAVLGRMAAAGVVDLFLIAGDGAEPLGPYGSAVDVLPVIAAHRHRPARIGITGYPEGHPFVGPETLTSAMAEKAPLADYVVSQLCFDTDVLTRWIETVRAAGIGLPIYVGLPGAVDRRRLLEISMRVGVGTSVAFIRKQRSMRHLFRRSGHAADEIYDVFAPLVDDPRLAIAGLHFFTFNQLEKTLEWERRRHARRTGREPFARLA